MNRQQGTNQSQSNQSDQRRFGTKEQIQTRVERIWAKSQIVDTTPKSIENFKAYMEKQFEEFAHEVAIQVRDAVKRDLTAVRTVLRKRLESEIEKAQASGQNIHGSEANGAKDGHGTDVQSV